MKTYTVRLHRGDDVLAKIEDFAIKNDLKAGVVLSGVGCVTKAVLRDAGGVNLREINDNMEIVSLEGTVSKDRIHLHAAFSKLDLSVIGGHLSYGTIVNTTLELCVLEQEDLQFFKEFDKETGYDELKVTKR